MMIVAMMTELLVYEWIEGIDDGFDDDYFE